MGLTEEILLSFELDILIDCRIPFQGNPPKQVSRKCVSYIPHYQNSQGHNSVALVFHPILFPSKNLFPNSCIYLKSLQKFKDDLIFLLPDSHQT